MWSFTSIDQAVLEKTLFNIFLNPRWLSNHVTYQLFLNKLVHPWLGEYLYEVSPRSVQLFWRRFFFIGFRVKSNMAAKPCDLWYHVWTFCSSWRGDHTCKVSPWSVQPFWRRFLKVFMLKTIWLPNRMTKDVINFFSTIQFSPRWPSKNFILIG